MWLSVITLCILLIIVISLVMSIIYFQKENNPNQDICVTESCVRAGIEKILLKCFFKISIYE